MLLPDPCDIFEQFCHSLFCANKERQTNSFVANHSKLPDIEAENNRSIHWKREEEREAKQKAGHSMVQFPTYPLQNFSVA